MKTNPGGLAPPTNTAKRLRLKRKTSLIFDADDPALNYAANIFPTLTVYTVAPSNNVSGSSEC